MTLPPQLSVERGPSPQLRRAALRRLVVKRLATGFGGRTAFVLGVVMTVGFAGWMLALYLLTALDAADVLLVSGVGWLCVVTGGVATLGLTTDLDATDGADGITALVEQRGYDAATLSRTHLYASVRAIAGTLLGPTLALSGLAVALSRSGEVALGRVLLGVGLCGYVVLLSGVLAGAARWSVAVDRSRARWVLAAVLLGPELARRAGVEVPGIPSLFAALLDHVAALGVAFL